MSARVARTFRAELPALFASDAVPEGAQDVIDKRFRRAATGPGGWRNSNPRTTFNKIIRRAGLTPWPRPFHNLRAIRETELVVSYLVEIVMGWLGNTPSIAMRHYLMTTDAHFESAIQGDGAAEKAAQNPARQPHIPSGKASQVKNAGIEKTLKSKAIRDGAVPCENNETEELAGVGFEPTTSGL